MNMKTLFLTYNPKDNDEQTLAIRLHSIGAVNGFRVYLPDRYNSTTILDSETKARIDNSDYVIMFAFSEKLSPIVQDELRYAYNKTQDKSKIIVVHGGKKGQKALPFATQIHYNPQEESPELVGRRIFETIFKKQQEELNAAYQKAQEEKLKDEINRLKAKIAEQNALSAFLGVGLGLALLALYQKRLQLKINKKSSD